MESDVSDVLYTVRVPTVVLSSEAERGPGRYFAEQIPGARLVELPSSLRGIYHWVDDEAEEVAMRETRKLAAVEGPVARGDRVLATVLFTDIVDSTERASEARRPCVASSARPPSRCRPPSNRAVSWRGDRYGWRQFLRLVRRARTRDRLCPVGGCRRARVGPGAPSRPPHRRVRASRREADRHRGSGRSPRRKRGRSRRGARLEHREGLGRRLRLRVRGPRRSRAEGSSPASGGCTPSARPEARDPGEAAGGRIRRWRSRTSGTRGVGMLRSPIRLSARARTTSCSFRFWPTSTRCGSGASSPSSRSDSRPAGGCSS